jgi:hypothetical protein
MLIIDEGAVQLDSTMVRLVFAELRIWNPFNSHISELNYCLEKEISS